MPSFGLHQDTYLLMTASKRHYAVYERMRADVSLERGWNRLFSWVGVSSGWSIGRV